MRVLMVSKACLVAAYRTKLTAIGRTPGVALTVIIPPSWRDKAGQVAFEPGPDTGYRLLIQPIRFNGNFHLHYYPQLGRIVRAWRPDILHMDEEPYNLATWLALRQAGAVGARFLFFSWQNIWRVYPWPFKRLEQQVLHGSAFAIMGNAAAADVWRRKGYTGPYRVIPQFGVCPDTFQPPTTSLAGPPWVIGSASRRLVPEKGVDLLLRAAALLHGDWRLRIAGDGPSRTDLERLAAELDISERVAFIGPLRSTEMPDFLHSLHALVLSSRTRPNWKEQFGRVLVEAMACAVPVVGSDSGEIPQVIGDAGLVFPEDDLTTLTQLLQQLLDSAELRQQLGQAGRARVLRHYTQDQIAAQTVAVYQAMLPPTN